MKRPRLRIGGSSESELEKLIEKCAIDWSYWYQLGTVELWEAVFLANRTNPFNEDLKDYVEDAGVKKAIKLLATSLHNREFFTPLDQNQLPINSRHVSLKEFAAWVQALEWDVPKELVQIAERPKPPTAVSGRSKTPAQERIEKIISVALVFGFDVMAIPYRGKRKIKEQCLKNDPKHFTDSTFDSAWKEGSVTGLISFEDKAKYMAKRLKN